MKISKQSQREARQLFRSCRVNGLLDQNRVRHVMALLLEKKPRGYVAIISRLYRLVKLDLQQHQARVESTVPLSAKLQSDVINQIKKVYGSRVDIAFSQDQALIGGLRIQVGSDLYDGSVKTRLESLEQSF